MHPAIIEISKINHLRALPTVKSKDIESGIKTREYYLDSASDVQDLNDLLNCVKVFGCDFDRSENTVKVFFKSFETYEITSYN